MKPLRHLSAAEVTAALPPLAERVALARRALTAIGRNAEMPPKIGVHPRRAGSLADAMPALLRGEDPDGDLFGVKWIVGMPENPSRGLPTYSALVIINDPVTGVPLAVMDGGAITTARTAAVSGAVIEHFMGRGTLSAERPAGPPARVALLGAGAQAGAHLPVIGLLLPGAELLVTDVDEVRADALAREASATSGIDSARVVAGVGEAVDGADVVVSVVSFGPERQALPAEWLSPDALVVGVDYDMMATAGLARESTFVVDETSQFLARRDAGLFAGFRDPDGTIGDALRGELVAGGGAGDAGDDEGDASGPNPGGPRRGRILALHLGVGLADVVFASAVLTRAETLGLGRVLPR
jgi:ornithine cyclodeaminase/alanine dehydrogenase-like protein (mu-crystallin family)